MRIYNIIIVVAVSMLAAGLLHAGDWDSEYHPTGAVKFSMPFGDEGNYDNVTVSRVVDGDTLQLATGERVRLIGIDTPELHESSKLERDAQRSGQDKKAIKQLGELAYEFTKKLVEGKQVRLEFDAEKKDKYGRLLAYAYLADGTFVNAEIVKQGYASLLTIPPNVKYSDSFLKLYKEARENKRGLWSAQSNEGAIYGTK